eukprot:gnl/MRDRNA2_/MRDRNA2_129961_c0_seq1.p1 gnl/MRDRNA2_/MRDRNA2_129961_c0~~gnl/MRDRNA2_/MRDRNA2_129961_c0_seq1.p1  ORF type:complete len:581 (+),score=99.09 gnl/MRDRNA2_/MRDRNA2_129961_c0_seq1:108-1850(+)
MTIMLNGLNLIDLDTFKVHRCDGCAYSHDSKTCTMYHHYFDRRRRPGTYMAEPCEHEFLTDDSASVAEDRALCPLGDMCSKCHNIVELLYHPDVYKRRLCKDESLCPRGKLCAFAHSRLELETHTTVYTRKEEQHPSKDFFINRYKTLWCPLPGVHDWDACIYAHTKRDIRRIPACGYSTRRCPDWEQALASEPKDGPPLPYNACCPRGARCTMAHGVKEALYHPASYRTRMCSGPGHCYGKRRRCCAFAHNATEQRPATLSSAWPAEDVVDLMSREQPQFHKPLVFAAFRDAKLEGDMPKTPSPRYGHREVMYNPSEDQLHVMGSDLICSDCAPLEGGSNYSTSGYSSSGFSAGTEEEFTAWLEEQFMLGSASAMQISGASGFEEQARQPSHVDTAAGGEPTEDSKGDSYTEFEVPRTPSPEYDYRDVMCNQAEDTQWVEDLNIMAPTMAAWPYDFFPSWTEEVEQALPAHAWYLATQDGPGGCTPLDGPRHSLAAELLSAELPRLAASEAQNKRRDDESTVYGSHVSDSDPTTASVSDAHGCRAVPTGPGSSVPLGTPPGSPPGSPQLSEYRNLVEEQ